MINNRRNKQSRNQHDEIADLQRQRLRLLQQRSNYRSNVQTEETLRNHNNELHRQTSSNRLLKQLSPLVDQLMNDGPVLRDRDRQELKNERRGPPNLEMDMSVINQNQEISSPRIQDKRKKPVMDKIVAMKNIVDDLLIEQKQQYRPHKMNYSMLEAQPKLNRYNSSMVLIGKKTHHNIQKQLKDLDNIEIKVTNQILSLRSDKINLIKDLNEETRKAKKSAIQIKRLEKQIVRLKEQQYDQESHLQEYKTQQQKQLQHTQRVNAEDSDKDSTFNNVQRDEDLRIGRQNVRKKIESEVTRYQQQKDIKDLQSTIARLQDSLKAANNHIYSLEERLQATATVGNTELFTQEIARLEGQLHSAQAVNQQIRASMNTAYNQLEDELMVLKADNEQLRIQAIDLLQQPQRRFTYQQQILRLKAEIEKENEAKALFAQQIKNFQRQYIELEEDNIRMRNRILQLEQRNKQIK